MHVVVAFAPNYGSADDPELGDAFWLVESPANRAVAELRWRAHATDPNSAIFNSGGEPPDIEGMFETVNLHHPDWSRIDFVGAPLTGPLESLFQSEGYKISELGLGFTISRKVR